MAIHQSMSYVCLIALLLIALANAQLFSGFGRPAWGYNAQGIGVDAYGNTFEGTPDNGIYLFCNGHGCPGRG